MSPLVGRIGKYTGDPTWIRLLSEDAAVLHVTAFAIETFTDRVLRRQESTPINKTAMIHFHKGLNLLRTRLLEEDACVKITNATVAVVLKLAAAALFDGDYRAARKHLDGLRTMIDLKGGLGTPIDQSLLFQVLRSALQILCFLLRNV